MGREVKRVPYDFDHPLNQVWPGYLMPDHLRERECAGCGGDGYSVEAQAIAGTFYPHQTGNDALAWHDKIGQAEVDNLVAQGRLTAWRDGDWQKVPRTADEVNEEQRARRGFLGHDAINRMMLVRFRCERLGITEKCPDCDGHGCVEVYPGQRDEAEAWERTEPPVGDGWQVWETVSEGSPVTPVFRSPDMLARHLSTVGVWGKVYDYATAFQFVAAGWAPSMMASASTGVVDGVEAVGRAGG
jgi:hypothetical protein